MVVVSWLGLVCLLAMPSARAFNIATPAPITLHAAEGVGVTLTPEAGGGGWSYDVMVDNVSWLSSGPFAVTNGATVFSTAYECAPHCLDPIGQPSYTSGSDANGAYDEVSPRTASSCTIACGCSISGTRATLKLACMCMPVDVHDDPSVCVSSFHKSRFGHQYWPMYMCAYPHVSHSCRPMHFSYVSKCLNLLAIPRSLIEWPCNIPCLDRTRRCPSLGQHLGYPLIHSRLSPLFVHTRQSPCSSLSNPTPRVRHSKATPAVPRLRSRRGRLTRLQAHPRSRTLQDTARHRHLELLGQTPR